MKLKKIFSLDPEESLQNLWLFRLAILIPLAFGGIMILTTLPFSHSFSWSTEGIVEFLSISKLQLSILSLAIPFGTVVAVVHRSEQTAKQISLSQEQSRFKNFYEHRCSFFEEIFDCADEMSLSKKDVSHLYKKLFPNSIDFDYRPVIPNEWKALSTLVKESLENKSRKNLLDFERPTLINDLEDHGKIENSFNTKKSFFLDFFKSLDRAWDVLRYEESDFDVLDIFGIHDDDDLLCKAEDVAKNCKENFEELQKVVDFLFYSSFVSHFSHNKEIRSFAALMTGVDVFYYDSPEGDVEFLLGASPPGMENIYLVGDEGIDNGKMVVLSFSVVEKAY